MISFYADENVDRRITNGLRRRGVDVLTAQEANLVGRIPDEQQLQFATDHGRVLLTADTDLLGIAHDWSAADHPYAGVVFYHPGWTSIGHVVNEVHGIAHDARPEAVGGRVLYISWDVRSR